MKKLLFCFCLLSALYSCKNDSKNFAAAPNATTSSCTVFLPLQTISDPKAQGKWLKDNEVALQLCDPKYDDCRVETHQMDPKDFHDAIEAHWGKDEPVRYTGYTLKYIKSLSSGSDYSKFICARSNLFGRIYLEGVEDFSTSPTCYSVPLFYSIDNKYKLDDEKTLILFTKAKLNSDEVIVFSIPGLTNGFFDYSHNPPMFDEMMAL